MSTVPLASEIKASADVRGPAPTVAVVIACYDEARWDQVLAAVMSANTQTRPPDQIFVVVDHNEPLRLRLEAALPPGVIVLANRYHRGAGGARNTAALHTDVDLVVFLDDDAVAYPVWLEHLVAAMQLPGFVGAGGALEPWWETEQPSWFPSEFVWTIGGTVLTPGTERLSRVRNVWSANLIVDRASFVSAGGFRANFGKVGRASEPEDTELCLRLSHLTGKGWAFVPLAGVRHYVPADRALASYFAKRCWLEGRGKASLRRLADHDSTALSSERSYLLRTLPRGFVRYIVRAGKGNVAELQRAVMLVFGVMITCAGFGYDLICKAEARPLSKVCQH